MHCRVCGREFDPNEFQVVVPGLGEGFHSVECAQAASALGLPPVVTPPVPAVVGPLVPAAAAGAAVAGTAAAGAPAAAAASSAPAVVGANLALLAAGTAATIYLWLRVFGADATSVVLPTEGAAPAFERSSVPAAIDVGSAAGPRPQPESNVRGAGSPPATEPDAPTAVAPPGGSGDEGDGPVLVATPPSPEPRQGGSGPSVRPDRPSAPPSTGKPEPPPHEPPQPRKPDKPAKPGDRGPGKGGGGGHGNPQPPAKPEKPPKPSKPDKPAKPAKPDKPHNPGKGPREKDHTVPHGKGKGEKKGHGKHH